MGSLKTRAEALALLHEYVQSLSLRRHCYAVAAAMEAYAGTYNENKDQWWMTGLLHDLDYEQYPSIPDHVTKGSVILREKGYDGDIIEAIEGHADYTGVPRRSRMARCLFAVDELCGFLVALSKVREDGFVSMSAASVTRALKKKGFAAAIRRDDIEQGIIELGVDREEHFNLVIEALRRIEKTFGFK